MSQIHPAIVILIAIGVALLAALKVFLMIKFWALSHTAKLWVMVALVFFMSGIQLATAVAALDRPSYGFPVWLRLTFAVGMFVCAVLLMREALKADSQPEPQRVQ